MSVMPVGSELTRAAEAAEEFADQLQSEGIPAAGLYRVAALITEAAEKAERARGRSPARSRTPPSPKRPKR